jgi:NhaP-type Na+/H+ or K+/H+ antiporter
MIDLLLRVAGSIVIGWMLGAAAGLSISRFAYDGRAEQLPIFLIPITIFIVFLASYALVPNRS